ncbi:serine--tRNA ligase [Patescibacteria group bacterium]|nr:serine--tRNA ligase [Patescibacteria group bacterium]MBU1890918.1 serine--tRNA ligase [Patescibacteria group bacterium]
MIDVKLLLEKPKEIKKSLDKRGAKIDIDKIVELDNQRRDHIQKIDNIHKKQNESNETISKLKGKDKEDVIAELRPLVQKEKVLKAELVIIEEKIAKVLMSLPNLPLDDVKAGETDKDNEVIKEEGEKTKFDFKPKDYLALGEKLDIIDIKRAAKVSGTRFGYLKNQAALLEIALVKYVFDILLEKGFKPVIPPALINYEAMKGMGYIEGIDKDEMYHFEKDNQFLIGTSEQSIGPMHMKEIFDAKELPLRYTAYSPCFRREAGSYGKDTKGIIRVHQFSKVEMFSYVLPDKSEEEQELMLSLQEEFVKSLELPYRVVSVCTGDLSFPSSRTYDLECWIPSEKNYRETHSTSNCTDFQARRLKIRYRAKSGNEFVHTLNGTAFAIGRILIALLENHQQKDGSIKIPKVLHPYCGFDVIK